MQIRSFVTRHDRQYLRPSILRSLAVLVCAGAVVAGAPTDAAAAAGDIVLYASDAATVAGNWSSTSDGTAAGGTKLTTPADGGSQASNPLASPINHVDFTFSAPANVPFTFWIRLQASNNSKYSDSAWVQFSDAQVDGSAAYGIGSTDGLAVNLATDSTGASDQGWGWVDGAYWMVQSATVTFGSSGTHTVRVQAREDGVEFDQIVLSPVTYFNSSASCPTNCTGAPGGLSNDSTIVAKPGTASAPSSSGGTLAYGGSPAAVPGQVNGENFDTGGQGTSYSDTTPGNAGGQYRNTDVDIESSSEGGYDIGWIAAGEWLNYTVNVASAGNYTVQLRVSSPSGATMHLGFNDSSDVWQTVSVPATGGWQAWTTVSVPVTLGAGVQQMTLLFDTGGMNYRYANVTGSSSSSGGTASTSSSGSGPYGGTPAAVPGTIQAANYDDGGQGVGYYDTTPGNSGGQYRSDDVDIEQASDGGYDIGWTAAGEWLNYTVTVGSAGPYTVTLKVASPNGGQIHVGFNKASNVWDSLTVPATGGWQNWTTVSVPVNLGAGTQQMTILFDSGGINLESIDVQAGASTSGTGSGGSSSSGGGSGSGTVLNVLEWNIEIDDGSESHARLAMDLAVQTSPQPDVIVIEEGWYNWFGTYIDELQNQTGQTWYGAWASHCAPGDWNGSTCANQWYQGVAILSRYPIVTSSSTYFPFWDCYTSARGAARAALDVNGEQVQVFATHLQTGGCTDDAQSRYNSMAMLKSWASNFSTPQLAAGDFNAGRDQIDTTQGMLPNFVDAWPLVGSGNEDTAFAPNPSMVIDYWFSDSGGRAVPQSSYVVQTTGTVSDHLPVHTTFLIR